VYELASRSTTLGSRWTDAHDAYSSPGINPRLIRLRDVPFYLGMDKNGFNAEVCSYVEILMGKQGVAFDQRMLGF